MTKTAYDEQREAEFREIARGIMARDRDAKKGYGNVDTAGAIKRALEKAYQRGRKEQLEGEPEVVEPNLVDAMLWNLIPPRPRNAFWSICLFVLGEDEKSVIAKKYVLAKQVNKQKRGYEWQLFFDWGDGPVPHNNSAWGDATIKPLCKRGLLEPLENNEHLLVLTSKGIATWWEGINQSKATGETHFFP